MKPVIDIKNVTIQYPLRYPDRENIRSILVSLLSKKKQETSVSSVKNVKALDSISLQIQEGERVGLIGANGSGKTTLLKMLSGVIYPNAGEFRIDGRINAILDPSLGMDHEASGIENIRIRSMLLGLPIADLDIKIHEITQFSELGDAIRRPIKTYSSGMMMRLMFSIATAIQPDILVMDEWLSAGDISFVSKALNKMKGLIQSSRILVLASHSEPVLKEWCTRLVWLNSGQVAMDGAPEDVIAAYKKFSQ
jgi:lipopolysaccharide transport system ATP-binding protein